MMRPAGDPYTGAEGTTARGSGSTVDAYSYAPSAPDTWDSNVYARRVYFMNLVPVMFIKGFDADTIGGVVAELDDHLRMTGADPVAECGPVGELASDLVASAEHGTNRTLRVIQAVLGIAYVTVLMLVMWLPVAGFGSDEVTVDLTLGLMFGVIYVFVPWMRWRRADHVVGRRPEEWRRASWIVISLTTLALVLMAMSPFLLHATGVLSESPPTTIDLPRNLAFVLLGVAVVAAVLAYRWLVRWTTVNVPGDPWHLRKLGNRFRAPW